MWEVIRMLKTQLTKTEFEPSQNQNHGKPSLFQWLFLSMWYEIIDTQCGKRYAFSHWGETLSM